MTDRAAIEAAVEMANEGLGTDAIGEIIVSSHVRAVPGGFVVATADGPVSVTRTGEHWTAT